MQIEAGKYYRNEEGECRGPIEPYYDPSGSGYKWSDGHWTYRDDGFSPFSGKTLVAECDGEIAADEAPAQTAGRKFDAGKLPVHLVSPEIVTALGTILAFGAQKYGERNWEKGMAWSRCFSAMERHMWAWWAGEEQDPETGYSHLWHAACCVMFLIAYEQRKIGQDDRPVTK